jgi:hypothetical protein
MSAHINTPSRVLGSKRRNNNNIRNHLPCRPRGQSTWDLDNSSSSSSLSSASESKDTVSDYIASHQPRLKRNTMSLTHYSPTDDDEDYTSSDTDHLFMKDSPRRQSSNGTASPPPQSQRHPIPYTSTTHTYFKSLNTHLHLSQPIIHHLRRNLRSRFLPSRTSHLVRTTPTLPQQRPTQTLRYPQTKHTSH